jgi:DNA uptake protein ComE-like DNA-binding protein
MKLTIAKSLLIVTSLLMFASPPHAADSKAVAPQQAVSKAAVSPPSAKTRSAVDSKAAAKVKLVNINGAKIEELKTLPGIGDAEAEKIIAGRPYGSKAHLTTRNIISPEIYDGVKGLVIATQPTTDATKNAELVKNKK